MTIRVGVVGAGFIGRDHLAAYAGWPDAQIAGVADVDLERARAAAAPYGAPAFDSLATMAAAARRHGTGLDAVSICVPTGLHLAAVREATVAGLHILLEKPMATTLAECDEIARLADAAGVTLMLGFTHRFHAELIRARDLIAAGRLGSIGLVHDHFSFGETGPWPAWYYARELSGGGELMHDAVHLVDRMAWLLDRPIVEVHGRTSSFVRGIDGVEDAGVATLAFEGGAIGSLFVHEATFPLHRDDPRVPMPGRLELEVHGTAGSLRCRTWHSLEFDSADEHWTIDDAPRDELRLEVGEFLAAIHERRPPSIGAADGRRGIAVIQAIYESVRLGRPVSLEAPPTR